MDWENKEIVLRKEAKERLLEGINELADAVQVTLGPNGKTVIIFDEYGKPKITKDGVSVSNNIGFKDPIKFAGATLVKEVAKNVAEEAGDGTTTATILARALINAGIELNNEFSISEIKDEYKNNLAKILKLLKKEQRKFTKKDLYKVAYVSVNNDEELSNLITEAYNYSNRVLTEEGDRVEDYIEFKEGIEYPVSYFSKHFITNQNKQIAELENAYVLLLDCKLTNLNSLEKLLTHLNQKQLPLLIITEEITKEVLHLLEANQINNALKLLPIKPPGYAEYRKEYIKDISMITGAKIITNLNSLITTNDLGFVKKVTSTSRNTLIIPDKKEGINELSNILKERISTEDLNKQEKELLTKRLENLNSKVAIIKVGGKSEVEMKEKKDRVEDAVLAVKSALEEGVVQGAGATLVNIANSIEKDSEISKEIANCLIQPFIQLTVNGVNKTKLKDVIDPFKVTRVALENAFSVAITIITTEAVVLNPNQW